MTDLVVTILAGLALAVAALGTIFPILPGSILGIITILVWAALLGSPPAWVAAGVGAVLFIIGLSAAYVLTGRRLKQHEIPPGPVAVGLVCAVIGMFVIPVLGLFVGFAVGLLIAEWIRHKKFRPALRSSWIAAKSLGLGMLVEFGCACLAGSAFIVGVWLHF